MIGIVAFVSVGCGGSGHSAPRVVMSGEAHGRASLKVLWPSPQRLIPNTANSLAVSLYKEGNRVAFSSIERPESGTGVQESTATFEDLPLGDLTVSVDALPERNGTGVPQARGSGILHVEAEKPGIVTVALDSTVNKLVISPITDLQMGETITLTATATDKNGNIVLLAVGSVQEPIIWEQNAPSVATLTPNGTSATLAANTLGTTNVRASLKVNDHGSLVTGLQAIRVVTPEAEGMTVTNSPSKCVADYTVGGYQRKEHMEKPPSRTSMGTKIITTIDIPNPATKDLQGKVTINGSTYNFTIPKGKKSIAVSSYVINAGTIACNAEIGIVKATGSVEVTQNGLYKFTVNKRDGGSVVNGQVKSGEEVRGIAGLRNWTDSVTISIACSDSSLTWKDISLQTKTESFNHPLTGERWIKVTFAKDGEFSFIAPTVTKETVVTLTGTSRGISQAIDLKVVP